MSTLVSLKRLLKRAPGMAVALVGPAGIGKTYRLEKFLLTFPGRVLLIDADEPLSRLPQRLGESRQENAWVSAFLSRLAAGESLGMRDAAAAFAERLVRHAPIVVVADHFHRASAEQRAFWLTLGERVQALKQVGLVVVTREEGPEGWPSEIVAGLSEAESAELVASLLPFPAPDGLLEWLREKAQGNPLYLRELVRHAERVGAFRVGQGITRFIPPERDTLPVSLTALIRAMLPDPLPPELQALLTTVLLQSSATGEVRAALSGPELHTLTELGLLKEGGVLAQPLYRDVLLPLLPQELVVQELQRLLAEQAEVDALLLVQLTASWPVPDALRAELLDRAAWQAARQLDFPAAAQLWGRAAHLSEAGRGERLWQAARVADRESAAQLALASVRWKLVQGQSVSTEDWQDLVEWTGEAQQPLENLAEVLPGDLTRWQAHHIYGQINAPQTNEGVMGSRDELWKTLTSAEQAAAPSRTLNALGLALYSTDAAEAMRLWQQAMACAPDGVARSTAQASTGLIPIYRFENEVAMQIFQQAEKELEEVVEQLGDSPATLDSLLLRSRAENVLHPVKVNLALLLFRTGEGEAFESIMQGRMIFASRRQSLLRYVVTANHLVGGLIELGRFAQAQDILLNVYPTGFARLAILGNLVKLYTTWNTEEQHLLLHYLHELADELTRNDSLEPRLNLALGWVLVGQFEQAQVALTAATTEARELDLSYILLYADWIRSIWHAEQGQEKEAAVLARHAANEGQKQQIGVDAVVFSLWASHFEGNDLQFQADRAALEALGLHGAIHAVQSRRRSPQALTRPAAHLEVLGTPRLFDMSGQEVRAPAVTGLLSALLCARLTGEEGLSELQLTEHLFPEVPEEQGVRKLARLVGRAQALLGEGTVVKSGERYMLQSLTSDAEHFLNEGADELWRGPVLGGQVELLLEPAAQLLLTRLEAQAAELLRADAMRAAELAHILVQSEPYNLDHLTLLLRAHDLAGQPRRAGALYRQARGRFDEVGEDLPERWQEFLLERVPVAEVVERRELALRGATTSSEARELALHPSTVHRWKTGQTRRPGQPGRPAQLSDEQVLELRRVIEQPPAQVGIKAERWTLKVTAQYVQETFGVRLSLAQLSRLLRKASR